MLSFYTLWLNVAKKRDLSLCLMRHNNIKTCKLKEVWFHEFLTLVLDGNGWPVSPSDERTAVLVG